MLNFFLCVYNAVVGFKPTYITEIFLVYYIILRFIVLIYIYISNYKRNKTRIQIDKLLNDVLVLRIAQIKISFHVQMELLTAVY